MTPEIRAHFEQLYALQRDCGLSLVELTVRFLIGDPEVTTIPVGATTPKELEESVAAAQQGPLPPDLHQAVEAIGLPY
jgi:aryl-alcohol dehydrogenase-like predicted oxidoreductase